MLVTKQHIRVQRLKKKKKVFFYYINFFLKKPMDYFTIVIPAYDQQRSVSLHSFKLTLERLR